MNPYLYRLRRRFVQAPRYRSAAAHEGLVYLSLQHCAELYNESPDPNSKTAPDYCSTKVLPEFSLWLLWRFLGGGLTIDRP
jgi:hypothetical protein